MSGVSLNTFVNKAGLAGSGEVRFERGDTAQASLINKGTVGQWLAGAFTKLGEALGVVPRDDTRIARQERTFEAFKAALVRTYGEDVATAALYDQRIDSDEPLTGRHIKAVIRQADQMVAEGLSAARDQAGRMAPGTEAFDEIAARVPGFNDLPQDDCAKVSDAYQRRLLAEVVKDADYGRTTNVTFKNRTPVHAEAVLNRVMELHQAGRLDAIEAARTAALKAQGDAILCAARGYRPDMLAAYMKRADAAVEQAARLELGEDATRDQIEAFKDDIAKLAIVKIHAVNPTFIGRIGKSALDPDGSLLQVVGRGLGHGDDGAARAADAAARVANALLEWGGQGLDQTQEARARFQLAEAQARPRDADGFARLIERMHPDLDARDVRAMSNDMMLQVYEGLLHDRLRTLEQAGNAALTAADVETAAREIIATLNDQRREVHQAMVLVATNFRNGEASEEDRRTALENAIRTLKDKLAGDAPQAPDGDAGQAVSDDHIIHMMRTALLGMESRRIADDLRGQLLADLDGVALNRATRPPDAPDRPDIKAGRVQDLIDRHTDLLIENKASKPDLARIAGDMVHALAEQENLSPTDAFGSLWVVARDRVRKVGEIPRDMYNAAEALYDGLAHQSLNELKSRAVLE